MLPNDFSVAKIHRNARAVAIPASESLVRGRWGFIPAEKPEGNHATLQSCRCHFVVVEIEQRLVGIHQGDVLPPVAIIVQDGEASAIRRIIQSRKTGEIHKGMAAAIREVTVAFVAVEGMDQYLISATLDPGEPRVDLRTKVIRRRGSFPFGGETKSRGEVLISAHH